MASVNCTDCKAGFAGRFHNRLLYFSVELRTLFIDFITKLNAVFDGCYLMVSVINSQSDLRLMMSEKRILQKYYSANHS